MRYFRELDIDNLDVLIAKCLAYVKSLEDVYYRRNGTWNLLAHTQLFEACPELEHAFSRYDLICNYAVAHVVDSPYKPPPHIDLAKYSTARINIPLLNCKNTRTEFFSNVVVEENEFKSFTAINTDYVFETYVELSKATVLRVKEAHRVVVPPGNPLPRISLTLGFNKDPVYLLE